MGTDDAGELAAVLPGYDIEGELGRGAFGVVLAGRHRQLGRQVAIKRLPRAFSELPEVRHRFSAEAKILASLDHPHIVPIFDYVEQGGLCVLVMELLPGGTVRQRQKEGLTNQSACAIVLATCSALDFGHQHGILHRDVKPDNLLFTKAGLLKVTDFGIAKVVGDVTVTQIGETLGTPLYMAPEQCLNEALGPATDVYSTGVMLYELLVGENPFGGSGDLVSTMYRQIHEDAAPMREVNPDIPASIEAVVARAMAKSPAARYRSARAFGGALAEAATAAWGSSWPAGDAVRIMSVGPIEAATGWPLVTGPIDIGFLRVPPTLDSRETIRAVEGDPGPAQPTMLVEPEKAAPSQETVPWPETQYPAALAPQPSAPAQQWTPPQQAASWPPAPGQPSASGPASQPAQSWPPAQPAASGPPLQPADQPWTPPQQAASWPPAPGQPSASGPPPQPAPSWPPAQPAQSWPPQQPSASGPPPEPAQSWPPGQPVAAAQPWASPQQAAPWPPVQPGAPAQPWATGQPAGPDPTQGLPYPPSAVTAAQYAAPPGNLSPPTAAPQKPGGRVRTPLLAAAVAVIVVIAVVAVVAIPALTKKTGGSPTPIATGGTTTVATNTAPTTASTANASQVASQINALIQQSSTARNQVVSTINSIESCTADAQQAAAALASAVTTRRQVVQSLANLSVTVLPNGVAMQQDLTQALNYSIDADHDYEGWLAGIVSAGGCFGQAPHDANWSAAQAASTAATTAKDSFASLWNQVATSYGLPTVTSVTI